MSGVNFSKDDSKIPQNDDKSLKDKITDTFKNTVADDPTNTTLEEKVSTNSKQVLIAIMVTLFGIVGLYTGSLFLNQEINENLNAVFIAAVSGLLVFAGTLVQNLWGK
jgi:hypothetical protein